MYQNETRQQETQRIMAQQAQAAATAQACPCGKPNTQCPTTRWIAGKVHEVCSTTGKVGRYVWDGRRI